MKEQGEDDGAHDQDVMDQLEIVRALVTYPADLKKLNVSARQN